MLRAVVLLSALAVLVKGQSTAVSQCTSSTGELPINAYVEGCTTPPCQLPRNQNAVVHMVFQAPYTIRRMQTYATAFIIVPIPYSLEENAETCNFLTNSYCPVLPNEILQYTLRMFIDNTFPAITVTIEFRIEDDDNNPIVCIRLPVTIVNAVNPSNVLNGTTTTI